MAAGHSVFPAPAFEPCRRAHYELDLSSIEFLRGLWSGHPGDAALALHLERRFRFLWRPAGGTELETGPAASVSIRRSTPPSQPACALANHAHSRTHLAMDLIDISRPLSPATAVWPGDQPVEWAWTAQIEDGSSVNLGALQLSMHAGTHVDSPYHTAEDGMTTDAFDLSVFVGPAVVLDVQDTDYIRPRHVSNVGVPRILFKTDASRLGAEEWPETITALQPETIAVLDQKNVVLVGTDAPSVDPLDSSELPAHHALIEHGIVNLEGLSLDGVDPGEYRLLSLPLRVEGADAAPVRAVLEDASP